MQTQFGEKNQANGPIVIPELEELEFKAIGEGLGFHQQEERPRWKNNAVKSSTQTTTPTKSNLNYGASLSRDQLGAIYQTPSMQQTKASTAAPTKNKNIVKMAGLSERITAQLADTLIVTFVVMAMLFVMLRLAQVPMSDASKLLLTMDVAPVMGILWLFIYISYFTILETRQTPGKALMRLKVIEMNGKPLTLSRSLERTVFRTLSWLALGFPLLMNFHGRLSRTQVIRA